jgi:hypothetical protein
MNTSIEYNLHKEIVDIRRDVEEKHNRVMIIALENRASIGDIHETNKEILHSLKDLTLFMREVQDKSLAEDAIQKNNTRIRARIWGLVGVVASVITFVLENQNIINIFGGL